MLHIRPARPEDAAPLTALARSAYAPYVARMGTEPAPMRENYSRLIRELNVWVAEDDATVVGLLVLDPRPNHLLLNNIAVSPAARNRGVGARLLRFAEIRARHRNLPEIRLYTNEAMTENLAYYPRHGYTETHRVTENGYHRVYFVKRLDRR